MGSGAGRVRFASYGNPSGACPAEPTGPVGLQKGSCHAPSSSQVVEKECLERNSCTIRASNDVFTEPCYGTTKYLGVDVECDAPPPPPPDTGQQCGAVREGRSLGLSCPGEGWTVGEVLFASYGAPRGDCRPPSDLAEGVLGTREDIADDLTVGDCHASEAREVVAAACVGRERCEVAASNEAFGDPCYGTSKRLVAAVRCVAADDKAEL